ncbi:MAG: hypothetical protein WKF42_06320 [Solirubrobacteraceae bacterium]
MTSDPSDPGESASRALEIRGSTAGLLDDPFLLRVRGAGPDAQPTWRARYRDDDGRVWRAAASRPEDLPARWSPAKDGTGDVAALRSLRPVSIEVRVETADGRAAARTLTRTIASGDLRTRRWRDGLTATLHVPSEPSPCATVIVDAGATAAQATTATLAAPLLASRGVLALVVIATRGAAHTAHTLATARERLSAVPGAADEIVLLSALDPLGEHEPGALEVVVLPPNVGLRERGDGESAVRAAAWDALLARLGARPRYAISTASPSATVPSSRTSP